MARLFTINFHYQGQDYSAKITVRQTPFFTEYNICPFDEALFRSLHSHTIVSDTNEQFRFLDCLEETELMTLIRISVTEHLKQLSRITQS